MANAISKPTHYQNFYTRKLTDSEKRTGTLSVKLDPYRICDVLKIGGGPREQILKKAMRWTAKGSDERQVLTEIMQACERRIEMLDEDYEAPSAAVPAPPPQPPQAQETEITVNGRKVTVDGSYEALTFNYLKVLAGSSDPCTVKYRYPNDQGGLNRKFTMGTGNKLTAKEGMEFWVEYTHGSAQETRITVNGRKVTVDGSYEALTFNYLQVLAGSSDPCTVTYTYPDLPRSTQVFAMCPDTKLTAREGMVFLVEYD